MYLFGLWGTRRRGEQSLLCMLTQHMVHSAEVHLRYTVCTSICWACIGVCGTLDHLPLNHATTPPRKDARSWCQIIAYVDTKDSVWEITDDMKRKP